MTQAEAQAIARAIAARLASDSAHIPIIAAIVMQELQSLVTDYPLECFAPNGGCV